MTMEVRQNGYGGYELALYRKIFQAYRDASGDWLVKKSLDDEEPMYLASSLEECIDFVFGEV